MRMRILLPVMAMMACAGLSRAQAAELSDTQKSAMCQGRKTCAVAQLRDAGTSEAGAPLTIAELHFGLADKPNSAPDEGCIAGDYESRDGGVEYWLAEGPQPPRLVLKLCNDGYGAAQAGEDEVTIGANELDHRQYGGSNWRSEVWTKTSLSPLNVIHRRSCYYWTGGPRTGVLTDNDPQTWLTRSIAFAPTPEASDDDAPAASGAVSDAEIACPDWPANADTGLSPVPGDGLVAGYDIPQGPVDELREGQAIGDCGYSMGSDGRQGFIVFGQPADAAHAAIVTAMVAGDRRLLVQVYDPSAVTEAAAAADRSWIHRPHIEIWVGSSASEEIDPESAQQIGIGLDGDMHAGVGGGEGESLPKVEHWQAVDGEGRPVILLRMTWPDSQSLGYNLGLVYSQSEGGKQARLVANTGIVKNRPLYLPGFFDPQYSGYGASSDESEESGDTPPASICTVRNGLLLINRP
jgi:hypothetical protein